MPGSILDVRSLKGHKIHSSLPSQSLILLAVAQSPSCVCLSLAPRTAACQPPSSSTVSQRLFKFMFIKSVILSNYLIFCHCLLLLPSIFPSIRSFPVSQLFASGGQYIGASAPASLLPKNILG